MSKNILLVLVFACASSYTADFLDDADEEEIADQINEVCAHIGQNVYDLSEWLRQKDICMMNNASLIALMGAGVYFSSTEDPTPLLRTIYLVGGMAVLKKFINACIYFCGPSQSHAD